MKLQVETLKVQLKSEDRDRIEETKSLMRAVDEKRDRVVKLRKKYDSMKSSTAESEAKIKQDKEREIAEMQKRQEIELATKT